jgi:hypothetical protein
MYAQREIAWNGSASRSSEVIHYPSPLLRKFSRFRGGGEPHRARRTNRGRLSWLAYVQVQLLRRRCALPSSLLVYGFLAFDYTSRIFVVFSSLATGRPSSRAAASNCSPIKCILTAFGVWPSSTSLTSHSFVGLAVLCGRPPFHLLMCTVSVWVKGQTSIYASMTKSGRFSRWQISRSLDGGSCR